MQSYVDSQKALSRNEYMKRVTKPIKTPKPVETGSNTDKSNGCSTSKTANEIHSIKDFFRDQRVQLIAGVVLLLSTLYFTIAYISYFVVGQADYDLLTQAANAASSEENTIQNWAGPAGAFVAHALIDIGFGIPSIVILIFTGISAIKLLGGAKKIGMLRLTFSSFFWLVWGSLCFAFIQYIIKSVSSHYGLFFQLGGNMGILTCDWLVKYIQMIGTLLLIIALIVSYFVLTNSHTIEHLEQAWHWVVALFRKKQATTAEEAEEENNTEEGANDDILIIDDAEGPNIIDLSDNTENPETIGNEEDFVVNLPQEEAEPEAENEATDKGEVPTAPDENEESISEEQPTDKENIGMDITMTTDELVEKDPDYLLKKLGPYDPRLDLSHYEFPSLDLLKVYPNETTPIVNMEEQKANKDKIVNALRAYGIEIERISATVGPTVTLYEIVPKSGTKLSRIQALENDIMMMLAATGIRIIAPIPGKGTVGIEVPNEKPQIVSMHSVIASKRFQEEKKMRLPIAMGRTITNEVFMFDLAKTPHLLVAGATGQGKSVGLNAIIASLLYKKHPAELKMVLVDPKMVEFTVYKDLINHYMAAMPDYDNIIITDCTKVVNTLNSLVIEMENRYTLLMDANCRNLEDYNEKFISRHLNPEKDVRTNTGKVLHHQFLPYIVIIIDEYGDFIMQAGKQVETPIARITQKARAVGMHMILATQRPSVNIVTGIIKANVPTRIAFRTQSMIDSRTVLDTKGAEGLVGKGDMLYSAGNGNTRLQCAFIDTPEVLDVVKHIREQQSYLAPYELPEYVGEENEMDGSESKQVDMKRLDPLFAEVARYVVANQQGSTSILQRKFEIGYNRAGKLTDQLESAHIVGPANGPKGRQVLVQDEMQLQQILESLNLHS